MLGINKIMRKGNILSFRCIKLSVLSVLGLASIDALSATITAPSSSGNGNYTVSWSGFLPNSFTLYENGSPVYGGTQMSRTFSNKPAGTYTYRVSGYSCPPTSYYGGGSGCNASTISKTVVVSAVDSDPIQSAQPEKLSVNTIQSFLSSARSDGKTLANLVGDEIESRLNEANLTLDERGLTYSQRMPNEQLRGGCSANAELKNLYATANLSSDSQFEVVMDSLSKPIIASVELIGTVEAGGKLKLRFGKKLLGKCIRFGSNTVSGDVKVDLVINTDLMINLNPKKEYVSSNLIKISIDPEVKLTGEMTAVNSVNVSGVDTLLVAPMIGDVVTKAKKLAGGGVIGGLLFGGAGGITGEVLNFYFVDYLIENFAEGALDKTAKKANSRFASYLAQEEKSLLRQLKENIPQVYEVPISPQHENEMLSFVSHYAVSFLPDSDFIKANGADIIYSLLVGDVELLKKEIATPTACRLTMENMDSMPTTSRPSGFKETSIDTFCGTVADSHWLGNAEPSVSGYTGSDSWTLMPSTKLNASTVSSIKGNYQPYTKRVHYRTIDGITDGQKAIIDHQGYGDAMRVCASFYQSSSRYTTQIPPYCRSGPNLSDFTTFVPIPRGSGTCKLEMRVYKKNVSQSGLKPLMAIHGGAWKYRGAGFYGMESQISHLTEKGFVVFAPFYRLTGELDGNSECNNATGEEIISDIEAALAWVKTNKTAYGASSSQKVRLFGQSAGAHLASWLLTHKSSDIAKALLMYPPTDAKDYLSEYQDYANGYSFDSSYNGSFEGLGVSAMEGFYDVESLTDIDLNDNFVEQNSFPNIIANNPSSYPPSFIVHGKVDRLVPAIQSVRMCNAYAGNPNYGPANLNGNGTRYIFNCGNSKLHLLKEADHMLELCLPPLRCEAGTSEAAISATISTLTEARNWLAN